MLILFLSSDIAYSGTVSKCTDSKGKVTFTDGACSRNDNGVSIDVHENSIDSSEGRIQTDRQNKSSQNDLESDTRVGVARMGPIPTDKTKTTGVR